MELFTVEVNRELTLKEMLEIYPFERVHYNITPQHFPIIGRGRTLISIGALNFGKKIISAEVENTMRILGYRPAKIEELIAFSEICFKDKVLRQASVAALGSIWETPSRGKCLPCLYDKSLYESYYEGGWSPEQYFACVAE
ncbi:MAG: hypothetical protein Athens101426_241 [Parcubacteria group bacterium Athens1014_26]|nr:MAG: hypothetical protein Athens101426_241 [Parcubacteria group bacterium Athens1014_26]